MDEKHTIILKAWSKMNKLKQPKENKDLGVELMGRYLAKMLKGT